MNIKDRLIALRTYQENPKVGICGNAFEDPTQESDRAVGHILSRYWPHFSGSILYPIPSPTTLDSPRSSYWNCLHNKWDTATEYGRLRFDALECLIKHSTELENLYEILKLEANL